MSSLSKTVREDLPQFPISSAAPGERPGERKVIRSDDRRANNRPIPSFWNFVEDDHVLASSSKMKRRSQASSDRTSSNV
jgi:hypothetical protein